MENEIQIEEYINSPLFDKKISANSWMVTMKIKDYLDMVKLKNNPYQRELQNLSFYKKLITDLLNDGVMPAVSVVYNDNVYKNGIMSLNKNNNFKIIDGLQRTNCLLECLNKLEKPSLLNETLIKSKSEFLEKKIYVEIWENIDLKSILYKMVVLNTGQKKMDYGHQLDILSESLENILIENSIEYNTNLSKTIDSNKKSKFLLSEITTAIVSYINRSPISGKKNAAEYLFNKLDVDDKIEKDMELIDNETTYKNLIWVLKDFSDKLDSIYTKEQNPLKQYDVFLVSVMAALGHVNQKALSNPKIKDTLDEKIELLNNISKDNDILKLDDYLNLANTFTSAIGDKRRKFIYETFMDFFLTNSLRSPYLEWKDIYDRFFNKK